jgi:hypothetical protein
MHATIALPCRGFVDEAMLEASLRQEFQNRLPHTIIRAGMKTVAACFIENEWLYPKLLGKFERGPGSHGMVIQCNDDKHLRLATVCNPQIALRRISVFIGPA